MSVAPLLLWETLGVAATLAFLQIRRCPAEWRAQGIASLVIMFVIFCLLVFYAVDHRQLYLFKADFSGKDLRHTNLSDAYLREADLSEANLSGTDLSGAELQRSDLSGADVSGTDLSAANLAGADLSGVRSDIDPSLFAFVFGGPGPDMSGAVLAEADLSGADLADADLSEADLTGADLSEAILSGSGETPFGHVPDANLSGADLSEADLTGAKITQHMVAQACGNENTTLPEWLDDIKPCPEDYLGFGKLLPERDPTGLTQER